MGFTRLELAFAISATEKLMMHQKHNSGKLSVVKWILIFHPSIHRRCCEVKKTVRDCTWAVSWRENAHVSISQEGKAISRVCPSVRPSVRSFVSTPSFEPIDLWTWVIVCIRIMTVARLAIKVHRSRSLVRVTVECCLAAVFLTRHRLRASATRRVAWRGQGLEQRRGTVLVGVICHRRVPACLSHSVFVSKRLHVAWCK